MECVGLYFFIPVLMEFEGSIGDFAVSAFICLCIGSHAQKDAVRNRLLVPYAT